MTDHIDRLTWDDCQALADFDPPDLADNRADSAPESGTAAERVAAVLRRMLELNYDRSTKKRYMLPFDKTPADLASALAAAGLLADPAATDTIAALASDVLAISALIDSTYSADLDPEAHRWRRCAKVSEECGEVTEALLGLVGENPRKGVTHDLGQVRKELLDVALAALGAVAHLDGNKGDPAASLADHAAFVVDRLRRAVRDTTEPEDA